MSQTGIRSALAAIAIVLAGVSAVALGFLTLSDAVRWLAASLLAGSLLGFFVVLAMPRTLPPTATPEEVAENRVLAMRNALLAKEVEDLRAAHELLQAELGSKSPAAGEGPYGPETLRVQQERDRALRERDAAARRAADLEAEVAHLRAGFAATEHGDADTRELEALRGDAEVRATELEQAMRRADAADEAAAAAEEQTQRLRARVAALEGSLRAATERAEALAAARVEGESSARRREEEAARAQSEAAQASEQLRTRIAALEAETSSLREAASRAQSDAGAAREALEDARRRAEGLETSNARGSEALAREIDALRREVRRLETDVAGAHERIRAAESARDAADASARRATGERDAALAASARAEAEAQALRDRVAEPVEPQPKDDGETARLREEVGALAQRLARAEEAFRAALHELGAADADSWPATPESVTRAVAPLTLFALGEGTPGGWLPPESDDTLAATVAGLRRQVEDRQRQIERLSAALSQQTARPRE